MMFFKHYSFHYFDVDANMKTSFRKLEWSESRLCGIFLFEKSPWWGETIIKIRSDLSKGCGTVVKSKNISKDISLVFIVNWAILDFIVVVVLAVT